MACNIIIFLIISMDRYAYYTFKSKGEATQCSCVADMVTTASCGLTLRVRSNMVTFFSATISKQNLHVFYAADSQRISPLSFTPDFTPKGLKSAEIICGISAIWKSAACSFFCTDGECGWYFQNPIHMHCIIISCGSAVWTANPPWEPLIYVHMA